MATWFSDYGGFLDFLALVGTCAPNSFPREDFLSDDEQLTLSKAFEEIEKGMQFVEQRVKKPELVEKVRSDLDAAREAFRVGDDDRGVLLLQDAYWALLGRKTTA